MEESKFIRSAEINEVAAALSAFQGEVKQPERKKEVTVSSKATNTKYKFKYADLGECVKVAAPSLCKNGLSVSQIVTGGQLVTLLMHKSGQYIGSELNLGAQQITKYQDFGSALTYLKRYSYCAILGLVADDDDDANIAEGNSIMPQNSAPHPQKNANAVAFTGAQLQAALDDVAASTTDEYLLKVWEVYSREVPSLCQPGTDFYKSFLAKRRQLTQAQPAQQ